MPIYWKWSEALILEVRFVAAPHPNPLPVKDWERG